MKQREKMLLAGLVGILVLWQGGSLFVSYVIDPVTERETAIGVKEQELETKKGLLKRSIQSATRLKEWKQRSLPPDPVDATSLYQNWLIDLATRMKLTDVSVNTQSTDNRPKGETYVPISVVVKAQGKFENVRDFLYEFRRAGLLHRVAKLTLASKQNTGDPVFDLDVTVEGLSLKDAPPRSTLLSDPKLADLPHSKPLKDRKEYDQLIAKNLFIRGYNGPPKPPTGVRPGGARPPGEEDDREFVYLVGLVSKGSVTDAALYDRSKNRETKLVAGGEFKAAGIEGKVVSLGTDYVILDIKGESWRLEIGQNLQQLQKVAAPAGAEGQAPG